MSVPRPDSLLRQHHNGSDEPDLIIGDFLDNLIQWFSPIERAVGENRRDRLSTPAHSLARLFEEDLLPDPESEYRAAKLLLDAGEPVPVGRQIRLADDSEAPAVRGISTVSVIGSPCGGTTAKARELADAKCADLLVEVSLAGGRSVRSAKAPADALADALGLLAVPASEIAATLEARKKQYVATLAGRTAVVVLTDAVSADQVEPFITELDGVVIVTSERELPSLRVTELVRLEDVETPSTRSLTVEEAMIRRLAGALDVRELDLATISLGIGRTMEDTEAALQALARRGLAELPAGPASRWSVRGAAFTGVSLRELGGLLQMIAVHARRCRVLCELLKSPALEEHSDVRGWAYGRWAAERDLFAGVLRTAAGGWLATTGAEPDEGVESAELAVERSVLRVVTGLAWAYLDARTITRDWSRTGGWTDAMMTVAKVAEEPCLEGFLLVGLGREATRRGDMYGAKVLFGAAAELDAPEVQAMVRDGLADLPRVERHSPMPPASVRRDGLSRVAGAVATSTGATTAAPPGALFGAPGNAR